MWTAEQRDAASKRALARWANPEYRISQGNSIKKPPKCKFCGETDIAKFYVDKTGKRTNKTCRECHKIQMKEQWHNKTPFEKWSSRVLNMYGITPEELKTMYDKQEGKCAICSTEPTTKRGLHVDHCHETGKVRGLLCHGCNVALGSFKDDVQLLNNAIKYLKEL